MKQLPVLATAVSAALALTALATATAPASATAKHTPATKIAITGWVIGDFDGNGPTVANHGTYTETCQQNDPIVQVDVLIKGIHVRKHAAYSWKATYDGQVVNSYNEHWGKNGTQAVDYVAYSPDNEVQQSGRLTIAFKIGHKKVATSYITLNVPSTC